MPGFPAEIAGTLTNRGKARRYTAEGRDRCRASDRVAKIEIRKGKLKWKIRGKSRSLRYGRDDRRRKDAGLPGTSRRDPHKPGQSPALHRRQTFIRRKNRKGLGQPASRC